MLKKSTSANDLTSNAISKPNKQQRQPTKLPKRTSSSSTTKRHKMPQQFKQQLVTLSRTISTKPFMAGSGIPRSFFQQQPDLNQQHSQQQHKQSLSPHFNSTNHPGFIQDPTHGLVDPTTIKRKKTKGELSMDELTPEQIKDTKAIVSLFTPQNMEKYPFLKLVVEQMKQGNMAAATETLYTVTRTLQQDLGQDPALQSLFDPTKHENFAQAMNEFVFTTTNQSQLEKPKIPKVSIQNSITTDHLHPNYNPNQLNSTSSTSTLDSKQQQRQLIGNQNKNFDPSAIPNPLSSFSKTRGKVKPQQSQQQQQPLAGVDINAYQQSQQQSQQQQQKPTKRYISSPPAPKQLSAQQWKNLSIQHGDDFEDFNNPSFLQTKIDQQQSSLKKKRTSKKEPLLSQLTENNPWYLPNGKLNVPYIIANAELFDEKDVANIREKDIEAVLDILQSHVDKQKTPHEIQMEKFDEIEQRSIQEGLLGDPTVKLKQRNEDQAAQRAQEAFGSRYSRNVPSTSTLASNTPKYIAKFEADKNRIDIQLGEPLLEELNSISKLSIEEKELMAVDPLRGSLTLLTPIDIERIKKEYVFSDPHDLIAYIKRFLGRAAVEVDHQYHLPRVQYEKMQEEYLEHRQKDRDLQVFKAHAMADEEFDFQESLVKTPEEVDAAYQRRIQSHVQRLPGETPADGLRERYLAEERATGENDKTLKNFMHQELKRPDGSILTMDSKGKPVIIPPGMDKKQFLEQHELGNDPLGRQDGDAAGNVEKSANFFQTLLGGDNLMQTNNDYIDPDEQLEQWQKQGVGNDTRQSSVGLTGLYGGFQKQMQEHRDMIDSARNEMERDQNKGNTAHDDQMSKEERLKIKHRAEYEQSLDMRERARLRAMQIAIKVGKQLDSEWIENKERQIMEVFNKFNNERRYKRQFELMMESPEYRSARIVEKTQQKLQALYKKYLPEPTHEEKQATLDQQIRQLEERGEKARIEYEIQQESAKARLRENQEQANSIDYALRQRQDALIRRQREVAMTQRALEWAAEGKTPAEIMRLENDYALAQAAKGIDVSPITATMKHDDVSREHKYIDKILENIDQVNHTQSPQESVNEALLARTQQILGMSSKTTSLAEFPIMEPKLIPPQQPSQQQQSQQQESNTTETKSLLSSVQKRRMLRNLKNQVETGTLPQVDENRVIQIPPEEFQKKVKEQEEKLERIRLKAQEQQRAIILKRLQSLDKIEKEHQEQIKIKEEMELINKERKAQLDKLRTLQPNPDGPIPPNPRLTDSIRLSSTTTQTLNQDELLQLEQAEIEFSRRQEELLMRSVIFEPLSLDLKLQPPDIDHLLENVPIGAVTNPQDITLPTTDPHELQMLQERNQKLFEYNEKRRIRDQLAKEEEKAIKTLAKQGLVDPNIIQSIQEEYKQTKQKQNADVVVGKTIEQEQIAFKPTKITPPPSNDDTTAATTTTTQTQTKPRAKPYTEEQLREMAIKGLVADQNAPPSEHDESELTRFKQTQYYKTMASTTDTIVIHPDDDDGQHLLQQYRNGQVEFSPEDEKGLKDLLGDEYIPPLQRPKPRFNDDITIKLNEIKNQVLSATQQQSTTTIPPTIEQVPHVEPITLQSPPTTTSEQDDQEQSAPITRSVHITESAQPKVESKVEPTTTTTPPTTQSTPIETPTSTPIESSTPTPKATPTPTPTPKKPEVIEKVIAKPVITEKVEKVAKVPKTKEERALEKEKERMQKEQEYLQSLLDESTTPKSKVDVKSTQDSKQQPSQESKQHKDEQKVTHPGLDKKRKQLQEEQEQLRAAQKAPPHVAIVDKNTRGVAQQHASALDAFFAGGDEFDSLFGGTAIPEVSTLHKSPFDLEMEQLEAAKKRQEEEELKQEGFIDIEPIVEKPSILAEKAEIARKQFEEQAKQVRVLQKSDTSILGKIAEQVEKSKFGKSIPNNNNQNNMTQQQEQIVEQQPEQIVEQQQSINDTNNIQQPTVQEKLIDVAQIKQQQTKSLFEKLAEEQQVHKTIQELQKQGQLPVTLDPTVPNKKKSVFSLTTLFDLEQKPHQILPPQGLLPDGIAEEFSEVEIEQIDPKTGKPTQVKTRKVKTATSGAFKSGMLHPENKDKIMDFLKGFRTALGLPNTLELHRRNLAKTPLLPPHLLEEFEIALFETQENVDEKQRRDILAAKRAGLQIKGQTIKSSEFQQQMNNLKTNDHDGYVFMLSVLYENGGNALLIVSRAIGQAQNDVLEGRIKTKGDFLLALQNYGMTKEMVHSMGPDMTRLFNDLEAEKLGLDQGGDLAEDDGTPVVTDPIGDQILKSERPVYGEKQNDLQLVAVMKRRERSKIFNDLDTVVDDAFEKEIVEGKGLFSALTQKKIPLNLNQHVQLPPTTGLSLPDEQKYKSKEPGYLNPTNNKANEFDDFFSPEEKEQHASKLAPETAQPVGRHSVFKGLLQAMDTDTQEIKKPKLLKLFQDDGQIRGPNTPFPNRLTLDELSKLDVGIKNRLEVLVDRISRHTLLSPALVLEKMENPREFGKLISSLTPEMVSEMQLIDSLLDESVPALTKKHQLEFADVDDPKKLTTQQMYEMLPFIQQDLKNLYDEQHSLKPRSTVFIEDTKREYLQGYLDPEYLGLEKSTDGTYKPKTQREILLKYIPIPDDINSGKVDFEKISKDVMNDLIKAQEERDKRRLLDFKLKEVQHFRENPTPGLIDTLMKEEKSQLSLLDHIQKSMEEKDKLLQGSLFQSIRDTIHGPNTRTLIVDQVKDKLGPLLPRRKIQLIRMKEEEAEEFVKVTEIVYNRLLANIDIMQAQLERGIQPQPLLEHGHHTPEEESRLIEAMVEKFNNDDNNTNTTETGLITTNTSKEGIIASKMKGAVPNTFVSHYDLKFGKKQLEEFDKNPASSPLAQLFDFWSKESTTQADLDKLTGELAHTTFGRLYKIFGAFFPQLPKRTPAQAKLAQYFEDPKNMAQADQWLDDFEKHALDARNDKNTYGDEHAMSQSTQLGRLVRESLEEAAISRLPVETQQKIAQSKIELEHVFKEYRQLEVMLDRQARLFILEREREQLGLPDFKQLTLLTTRFELILSTLQSPGLHPDKKQKLMDQAKEVMAQTIAVRNLKESDPEIFYWRSFLAQIPPAYHKIAVNCHNMPVDPMRLFDDLNPTGQLSPAETLKNVIRFMNENHKDTLRLFKHLEERSTGVNSGSSTMTLRDIRKEQVVCRRLLKLRDETAQVKTDAKAVMTKHYNENYIHQLRIVRMKQLMDEPDANEAKRQALEFWLDEANTRGKKAGLRGNALLQDIQDNFDSPVGAINMKPGVLIAHKKMLKRRKATIDPVLFNSKTSRLFTNDRLNPLVRYEKLLQKRGERRKQSLRRLAAEEELDPLELATINAAREGNRILAYLGTHGAGSNNMQKDMQDLLKKQQQLLEEQKLLLENNNTNNQLQHGQDESINVDTLNTQQILDSTNKDKSYTKDGKLVLNPQPKHELITEEQRLEKRKIIETQLTHINKQISNLITRKEDFDATLHIRHDNKDSSLVHIANQPYVYGRVVASYGQTVVVEQCGSNSYMKHSQFFVQDELEQIQRAAGVESAQLDNRDNLDAQDDDEFDENGNPIDGQLTIPKHERKRNAVRGNRRRWHCIKSRHMDLLCGDYVFIDPAPGRAWTSGANESTAQSTLNAMNNTGADDHGVVKAAFSRMNMLQKSGRSTSKLQHLEEANPVCANIDHMVILTAAEGQPPFTTSLIDRYLAAAQFAGIKATIVYNKIDLIEMVAEAEKIVQELKEKRLTLHEKEKTLRKKMGKKDFKKMKQKILKDQKKKLNDTHFYTTTMQRHMKKLLYSDSLAKELKQMEEEEEYENLVQEFESKGPNADYKDLYQEDDNGRLILVPDAKEKFLSKKNSILEQYDHTTPVLVKRADDPTLTQPEKRINALDYYYNDEEYDDEEEDRVLLEQQLMKWITKKKRQSSREVEEKLREYERIGVKVIRVSAKSGVGIDELEKLLGRFHSTGFVGQSGVGKTSLLNSLIPDLDLQTNNMTVEGKGQHTTTSSRMFHLPNGGSVIDTPGSQSFIPPAVEPEYVQELFPEIKALAKYCKLGHKCQHSKEVGCAVREAVGDGSNRAIIPVTITELFDPLLINNMRVKEFRARLEAGELRELASKYAGNDPVLLYAQRFYQDLDSGRIMTSSVHAHIPLDTAVDLGAKFELDERGQAIIHATDEVRTTTRATNSQDFERYPANVIPLEESDIESDGTELPYHIRKLKHDNRELEEMIRLKLQHFGEDAEYEDEEYEIEMNKIEIENELHKYYVLKQYKADGGTPGDANDPFVVAAKQAKAERKAQRAQRELEHSEGEFDFNFNYNIEDMAKEIIRVQKSDLLLDSEHLKEAHGVAVSETIKEDVLEDARKTAIALAEIDLQDRLKKYNERKQRRMQYKREQEEKDIEAYKQEMEQQVLQQRADALGITVEKLLEYQEIVKKQREEQRQQDLEDERIEREYQAKKQPKNDNNVDNNNNDNNDANFIDEDLQDIEEPQDAEYEMINPISTKDPNETNQFNEPTLDRPLTRKEKYALLRPKPTQYEPNPKHTTAVLGDLHDESKTIQQSLEHASDILLTQQERQRVYENELKQTNAPEWRKQRDKLTQRRFASKLPANANAYIPQFRYDNYLALVELMKKTEEFLEKRRKKKSLTKQEEQKIAKREKQAEMFEKRQLQRRRLLADEDPFGVRQDIRALEAKSRDKIYEDLKPHQLEWFRNKIQSQQGVPMPTKLHLIEGDVTKPIRGKTPKQEDREYYNEIIDGPQMDESGGRDRGYGVSDDVRQFQHEMLTQMSEIYNERKTSAKDIHKLSHGEHWRRTGALKNTFNEWKEMDAKREKLSRLSQSDQLTKNKFGGVNNTTGDHLFMGNFQQYSDHDDEQHYNRMIKNQHVPGLQELKWNMEQTDVEDNSKHVGSHMGQRWERRH